MKLWAKSVAWIKLEVITSTQGKTSDYEGTVEFKAYYFENGQLQCIHENSFFEKDDEHWVYVSEHM